jgi:hypothetical protein
MKKGFLYLSIIILLLSCVKQYEPGYFEPVNYRVSANGIFILNEGNFGWGNGSLSYYSYDSSKIYNNFFESVNKRPLGDVPYSMLINGDNIYIVVNNSEKIEVIDRRNLKSVATITGLISPRNIVLSGLNKAYVTSMYSDSVRILDLKKNTISGYINIHQTSESVVVTGQRAFIANWLGGNKIFVVNTETDVLIDSVEVGKEPESMAVDKNGMIWVLSNGGWKRDTYAELTGINPQSLAKFRKYVFPTLQNSPLNLQADGDGDTLYYIDSGIRRMSISSPELPADPMIDEDEHLFYKVAINPLNGDIVATDAVDYQQNGFLLIFNRYGALKDSRTTGIIPGSISFMLKSEHVIQ